MAFPCVPEATATQLTLVTPYGIRYPLITCATPFSLAPGGDWRGMTPYAVTARPMGPSIAGEEIVNVRATARTITVPIIIHGDTETQFDTNLGLLESRLTPAHGPCSLIYQRADGTTRELICTYIDGATNLAVHDLSRERHVVANVVFRAHYPYWRLVDNGVGTNTGNFLNAAGAGVNSLLLNNTGNVDTWPEITLTGPLENVEMINLSTGQMFRVIEVLATGQTIRIESDPRSRAIWLGDEWRPDVLDPAVPELWPLIPAQNRLYFRATSPGDAGTWQLRWPILFGTC